MSWIQIHHIHPSPVSIFPYLLNGQKKKFKKEQIDISVGLTAEAVAMINVTLVLISKASFLLNKMSFA